jgi:prepilin-type N-terminal cleavage/methylation domain-containing protein
MDKRKGFTIVELLTSIVIIALLLGLLLPSLAKIRRSAKEAAQKVQFAAIDTALEAFKQDYGDYPPSNWQDIHHLGDPGYVYSGAERLAEALLGRDLKGFNPHTVWCMVGLDSSMTVPVYTPDDANLRDRKGPYLDVAKTNVFRLRDLYTNVTTRFNGDNYVICDVFGVKKAADPNRPDVKAGTPILYYKANTNSKSWFCPNLFSAAENSIYNHFDNYYFLNDMLILPGCTQRHALADIPPGTGRYFCNLEYKIVDRKVPSWVVGGATYYWPNRPDSYILISAGADHNFGTSDDILNY